MAKKTFFKAHFQQTLDSFVPFVRIFLQNRSREDPAMSTQEEMPQHPVLTLKNLYRLLTMRDYPHSSWPVFSASALKGQTVVRFWYHLFQSVFSEKIDLSVFEPGDRPNRNLPRLLNRSGSSHLMNEWFHTLSGILDMDLFFQFTTVWMEQLDRCHYLPASLDARLERYAEEIASHQDLGSEELSEFFSDLIRKLKQTQTRTSSPPMLFSHAVVLTWMTLYALYGSRPTDSSLTRLRIQCSQPFSILYAHYRQARKAASPEVLTSRESVLCVQPLSEHAYFGNEDLIEEAAVRLFHGAKIAVTGIGGVGKTELVRQLLARLNQQNVYQRLAFVQYQESLDRSFREAFPAFRDEADVLSAVRRLMEDEQLGRTLLLLDNVDSIPALDPALNRLADFGCSIILTSRLAEPDGFSSLHLSGLDPKNARELFYCRRGSMNDAQEDVDALCSAVAWHPLTISLFASLCRARFWSAEKLTNQFCLHGLTRLSYVRQASPVNLADVFRETFRLSCLHGPLEHLLRLLAMLPYRYWLPEALLPYTPDFCSDADTLADMCSTLRDLGWLLAGEEGYAIHPMIAETVRLDPCCADDYPLLWKSLSHSCSPVTPDPVRTESVISLLIHMKEWNATALHCLADIEQEIGVLSVAPPETLYNLHRQYLDDHPHTASEEADYWLGLGLRDIVILSRRDRLPAYLHTLLALEGDIRTICNRQTLMTLLEYCCRESDLTIVDTVFSALRPSDEETIDMADYLISFSVRQRVGDHDLPGALSSLEQADALLGHLNLRCTLRQSNLDYRRAVCLLDLGRSTQARPLLERCLQILQDLGYSADSPKVLSTRSTYAFSLTQTQDVLPALREYEILSDTYLQQGRKYTAEYIMMRNNMSLVLDSLKRQDDARSVISEVLSLGQTMEIPGTIRATHLRNAALIFAHSGVFSQADLYADEAVAMRKELFGHDSPWTADAEAVKALILAKTGRGDIALPLIRKACAILEHAWGQKHRHVLNAKAILKEIAEP